MICKIENTRLVTELFAGWQETLIWSCLDGSMGAVYAESDGKPKSAMAQIGDFCFFAGVPDKNLVSFKPKEKVFQTFVIMCAQTENWNRLIEEVYGQNARRVTRYAIKKQPDVFNREKLQQIVQSLPAGFELKAIDQPLYRQALVNPLCRDWCSQFADYEQYQKHGLGFVILKEGQIVSGASSYSFYKGGVEIEIDTEEIWRGKGLAKIAGAKMVLECLNRGLYPSWDAANQASVHIAQTLGYSFDHEYICYHVNAW